MNRPVSQPPPLRQAMAWLHTWAGVVLGGLLLVIFFMGSLAVFDREIDRWMMPVTRLAPSAPPVSLDSLVLPAAERLGQGKQLEQWYAELPDMREPLVRIRLWDTANTRYTHYLDPRGGRVLPDAGTLGGSSFFYPFHYSLHLWTLNLGYWIVGVAAMAMLVLLVSGVIIHARLFKDFFTFRPHKSLRRSTLDLHNLTGVLALPFHFVITLSGLIIFFYLYLPAGILTLYPDNPGAFSAEAGAVYTRPPAGRPGRLASLDAMLIEARGRWGNGEPHFVRVWHPGDANAYVEVGRSTGDRIRADEQTLYFDGASGALLLHKPLKPAASLYSFFAGLHFAHFDHWPLRWLYFLAGLSGCVMIAAGLVYWIERRSASHACEGRWGSRMVAALACAAVTGLPIATAAMLIANRLLPLGLPAREKWEVAIFFIAWSSVALHAAIRVRLPTAQVPWRQQCWLLCGLAAAAPLLNWLTTGDHLLKTLFERQWAVAGVDAVLLATAAIAAGVALKLGARRSAVSAPAKATLTLDREVERV